MTRRLAPEEIRAARFVAYWLLAALAILGATAVLSPRAHYNRLDAQPPWLRMCRCPEPR